MKMWGLLTIIVGLGGFIWLLVFYLDRDLNYSAYEKLFLAMNSIRECNECGMFIRNGQLKLMTIKEHKECPYCNSSKGFSLTHVDHEKELPFSPKFSLRNCIKIKKLEAEKENVKLVESQLDKYLKVQNKKLNHMHNKAVGTLGEYK